MYTGTYTSCPLASVGCFMPTGERRVLHARYRASGGAAVVATRPNTRVQVMPLARLVNRGGWAIRPVPSFVPFSLPASGTPDADRWAARTRESVPGRRRSKLVSYVAS